MSTCHVPAPVGVHLVGSLNAPTATAAMRVAGTLLGRHLHAISDGETGPRRDWVLPQLARLASVPGLQLVGLHGVADADDPSYRNLPALSVDPSVTSLPRDLLGYAAAATSSYALFRRFRDQGVIPDGVRFQVSLPTPYATTVMWVRERDQVGFLPVCADALADELAAIVAAVDPDDLLVQYDVAVEIGALLGYLPACQELAQRESVVDALYQLLACTPDVGELGVHFCYRDYRRRHFTRPADLGLCVDLAREVAHLVDVVHMPVDRDAGRRAAYFEPLRDLHGPRLALGVVDDQGDAHRTHELLQAAADGTGGRGFAVAADCGLARAGDATRGSASLARLLALHAQVAAPVR